MLLFEKKNKSKMIRTLTNIILYNANEHYTRLMIVNFMVNLNFNLNIR